MKLYAIRASRSGASVMGAAEAFCKWSRRCHHCKRIIKILCGDEHEYHAPKILVYLTRTRAEQEAQRMNRNLVSANVHYTAVLCKQTSL